MDCEDDYNITWYDEEKPLGTGGRISLLRGGIDETLIFSNCDALPTTDYDKIFAFHRDSGNEITMICAYKGIRIPY